MEQITTKLESLLELLELIVNLVQIYFEGLCYAATDFRFNSVVEIENEDEKSHIVFDDESLRLDYIENKSGKGLSWQEIQDSMNNNMEMSYAPVSQNIMEMTNFSKNLYVDDRYFGIID